MAKLSAKTIKEGRAYLEGGKPSEEAFFTWMKKNLPHINQREMQRGFRIDQP